MRRVFCLVAAACALLLALASAPSVHAAVMGIDFGSEFIKVASVKPGTPFHIVVDEQSKRKIPSVVAFDNGERHFGNGALQLALRKPKETYLWAHRLLGKDINSPQVAELRRQGFPWEIVELPGRNSLGFRHSTAKNADDTDVVFSVEEVVAMSLQHVMKIAETDAESPVKDCVITVPPYFTHRERAALLDAAEIAGLNVMSLLNENTAAAIQYGIDRKFVANETHTVLFYNMGSTSTKVDLAVYSAYVKKERGGRNNNKTIGQFEMRGMGYDDTLGGNAFEHRIAEWIIREVNQQLASKKITYDITTNMKAMAKIRSAAEKAKTVLSANQESLVFLNSLYEDTDFKMMLTREQFYEMTADLIERAANPIQQVIDDTGVTLDQIDAVVIIGGSVRIPAVQASIKAFVGKEHLTQSLNGDEAMVMGAVFRAANLSATFKVRPLGLVDTTPYAVGVRVTDQEVEVPAVAPIADGDAAPAEVDEESASSGSARASFSKRASLFKRHNRLERKKTVQIPYTADFKAQLAHEVTKSNALPTGISTPIDLYNITGLTQLMNNTRYADLLREQEPRVSLSFLLDQSGMTSLVRAEAALDEMVKVPVPKKKPAKVDPEVVKENDTDAAAAEEEKAPESDATQTEGAEGDNTDAEKADAAAEKAESEEVPVPSSDEESASTDAAESSDAASESESAAAAVEEEEPEFTLKKKTHTIQLKVTKVGSPGSVAAMTQVDKIAAKAALAKLRRADDLKKEIAATKNTLEAYIYSTRSALFEPEMESVSTEDQRETTRAALAEAEDWLYEQDDESAQVFKDKLAELKLLAEPIFFRLAELTALPTAINTTQTLIAHVRKQVADYTKNRPWVPEADLQRLKDKADDLAEYVEDQIEAQSQLTAFEPPVFESEQLYERIRPIHRLSNDLQKLKKPIEKPKKKSTPKKTKKNDTATDDAAEEANKDAETAQQTEEEKEAEAATNAEADDTQTEESTTEEAAQEESQQPAEENTKDEL